MVGLIVLPPDGATPSEGRAFLSPLGNWSVETEDRVVRAARPFFQAISFASQEFPIVEPKEIALEIEAWGKEPPGNLALTVFRYPDDDDPLVVHGGWGDLEDLVRDIARAIGLEAQARYSTVLRQAVRRVEMLVASVEKTLEDENSDLRRQLDDARIEIAFLRGQLLALRDAVAMGRMPIASKIAGVIGAILLAVTSGGAGGIAQEVAADRLATDREPTVVEYIQECEAIQQMLAD